MALTAAQKTRLEQIYQQAVRTNQRWCKVSQSDLQAALLVNDGSDPVASVLNPSIAQIYPAPVPGVPSSLP